MADRATPSDQYQVSIVKYGHRSTTRSDVYLNYAVYGESDEPIDMDYFFWVIRNSERTVLVDTGFSRAGGKARARTFLLDPEDAFARAGVNPADGPQILLTHGHYDHIGNVSLFPTSRIVMARREFDFWTGPHAGKPLFHHSVENTEIDHLVDAEAAGRVTLFDTSLQVAPGIRIVEVGGHTPGQSVVFVDTDEGTVLLASDAVHYYEEFERDMIFTSVADLVAMYDCFASIRNLVETGEVAHVVSGHDPATLDRFKAATGDLAGYASTIGSIASRVEEFT